jgi:uncharacterized RDD family membrane protein YckC
MGYSVYWLGVHGKPRAQLLQELGLQLGAETTDNYRPPLVGVTLPDGWFVVMLNRHAPVWYADEALAALSADGRVITCEVEEHAMYSGAVGFAGGREVWRMVHDEGQGLDHLETQGDLPPEFPVIHAEIKQRHDAAVAEAEELGEDVDVDHFFDVPADLAEEITGYRHDARPPPGFEMHELVALAEGMIHTIPAAIEPPPAPGAARTEPSGNRFAQREPQPQSTPPPPRGAQLSVRNATWPLRGVAFLLDLFAAFLLSLVGALLVVLLESTAPEWLLGPLAIALPVAYLLLRDAMPNGQSVGKRSSPIRVVRAGGPVTARHSLLRNLPLVAAAAAGIVLLGLPWAGPAPGKAGFLVQLALVAYEAYCVVAVRLRLGDRLAGTRVVEVRLAASPDRRP